VAGQKDRRKNVAVVKSVVELNRLTKTQKILRRLQDHTELSLPTSHVGQKAQRDGTGGCLLFVALRPCRSRQEMPAFRSAKISVRRADEERPTR
jgi:hypothetical protein